MKKEALLMLVAGTILGAVMAFIATRQYYQDKLAAVPPATAPSQIPPQEPMGGAGAATPDFDPAQHTAMVAEMEASVAKDPKNVEMRVQLANFFYDAQQWDKAVTYYEQALKLTPENTDVLVDLGVCYRNMKRPDEALTMFARALKVDPAKKQALYNEIVVYGIDKGDKVKARALLKDFEVKYPGEPAAQQIAAELDKR